MLVGGGYGSGGNVTKAGLLLVPSSLAMVIAGPLGGIAGPRVGYRAVQITVGAAFGSAAATAVASAPVLPGDAHPAESGFTAVFWIGAASGLLALLASLAVPPPNGRQRTPAPRRRQEPHDSLPPRPVQHTHAP